MPDGDRVHEGLPWIYQKPYMQICDGQFGSEVLANDLVLAVYKDVRKDGDKLLPFMQQTAEQCVRIHSSQLFAAIDWQQEIDRVEELKRRTYVNRRMRNLVDDACKEQLQELRYATIWDVILHIRYAARQGVDPTKVKKALDDLFKLDTSSNLALLFSLRHDFPTEWAAFGNGTSDFTATFRKDYFPYFTQGKTIIITGLELYRQDVTQHHAVGDPAAATNNRAGQAQFTLTAGTDSAGPTQVLTRTEAQVFLIVRYSF